ncbi:MAG: phage protease [Sphingomicrobium sp.]
MRKDVELRASAALSDVELVGGRAPNRIMLMPIGEAVPRDGRKPWFVADRAHAEEIVVATQKRLGSTAMMIDYDHQSRLAPKVAGRAMAAGWVEPAAFHVEDSGIYVDVEWTAAARSELRDRQYRYISPDFGHTKDGRVTRLFAAALTNTPALELAAVASAHSNFEESDMKFVTEKLGLPEDADETAITAAIDNLLAGASLVAIASALSLAEDANAEEIATAAAAAAARPEPVDLKPIAAALDQAEDANVEQLATAAAELKAGVIDPTKYVPIETHQLAIARAAKIDEDRATAAVDAAIREGKVAPASRNWALGLFKKDEGSFVEFVATAAVILKPGEEDVEHRSGADQLTEEETAVCSMMGVKPEDYLKTKKDLA